MSDFRLDVHLHPDQLAAALAADVRAGLTGEPKTLPPKWFYDAAGSRLFDEITRLPEYYPTRREKQILTAHAGDIAASSRADTLVELGAGTSEKSRWLLDALRGAGTLRRYVPFDVDAVTLEQSGRAVAADYPGLAVHAVCGDFAEHLPLLPGGGRRLVAFLGGTIGNLQPAERKAFYADLRAGMSGGDALLLGTDLVKDAGRLVAAYDDAAGVTAAFNKNVLAVMNTALGADFELAMFEHRARFDEEQEWIEMLLVARADLAVHVAALDLRVHFAQDEALRTEISAKFRRDRVEAEVTGAGFSPSAWWTDPAGDYALSLWAAG